MNEQEKSLKLAELMEFPIVLKRKKYDCVYSEFSDRIDPWTPYNNSPHGLAQFAAILLKEPGALDELINLEYDDAYIDVKRFTQTNILDEVLRMNGVDV